MAWISFTALPCRKKTWWQLASRCCWNRTHPWHASELVSFLVRLRTYQDPGTNQICNRILTYFCSTKCICCIGEKTITNRLKPKNTAGCFRINILINNRKRFYGYLLRMKTDPQKVSNIIYTKRWRQSSRWKQPVRKYDMKREGRPWEEMVEVEQSR